MGVCGFFLQVKFATSLLASLAGGKFKFTAAVIVTGILRFEI